MLFNLTLSLLISLTPQEVEKIINLVPDDWYTTTTRLFEYCVDVNFKHPICPLIHGDKDIKPFESSFYAAPIGKLTPKSLFQATVLYQVKRPPDFWFATLKLDERKPLGMDSRLWAEARWLWAKILFDKLDRKQALKYFDLALDELRMRPVFHQQRAWAQFFNGQYDRALGSIISAESPLLVKVPFFEKFFLRALVEKETCNRKEALNTIAAGRIQLSSARSPSAQHPWVVLCEKRVLGETCKMLRTWYDAQFAIQIKRALEDLDLLEVELRDANLGKQDKLGKARIEWPTIKGEHWRDELGNLSVPIKSKC